MEQQLYRPKDAAKYLGIGLSTFWLYVQQKKLKTNKLSERVTVVKKHDLEAFVDNLAL